MAKKWEFILRFVMTIALRLDKSLPDEDVESNMMDKSKDIIKQMFYE